MPLSGLETLRQDDSPDNRVLWRCILQFTRGINPLRK